MMKRFVFIALTTYISIVCSSSTLTIRGRRSSRRDDAESRATCPVGYVVSYCEVETGFVHYKSDGAFVDPRNPRVCVAVNGNRGSGAIARAVCSRNGKVADPCNNRGPDRTKFLIRESKGSAPRVSCPPGYEQVLCNARSPWSGLLDNKGVNAKGVIPNGRSCSVSRCSRRNWCQVTAVCQIKTPKAYINDVCKDSVVVVGKQSGRGDDAESRAICPVGYVVTYCEVQTGFVHYKSDGAFVDPGNARVCVAVNGYRGSGAIARARCSRNEKVVDPCNKRAMAWKFLNRNSIGSAPLVSCPPGYDQILCNARSPWSGLLDNKGVNAKGVIPNGRSCSVSRCSHRNWCQVTSVCRINDKCRK